MDVTQKCFLQPEKELNSADFSAPDIPLSIEENLWVPVVPKLIVLMKKDINFFLLVSSMILM